MKLHKRSGSHRKVYATIISISKKSSTQYYVVVYEINMAHLL